MRSKRVLAFLVLAVFPPTVLVACAGLFNKDAGDAGADAAAAVSSVAVEPSAPVLPAEVEPAAPLESAAPAQPAGAVVTPRDAGAKIVDAGTHTSDAAVPTPTPDAGKVPTPTPGGLKIPSGFPTSLGSLKIPSGFPKLPNQ